MGFDLKDSREKEGRNAALRTSWVLLSSLFILIIGCIGYFSLPHGLTIFYIFAHLGAVGLLGLIGGAVGILARKKGRAYSTAFFLGSLLPIITGLVAVVIFILVRGHLYCGGSVSLAVAVLVLLIYALTGKKSLPLAS